MDMDRELSFSGFIDKDKKEHNSIIIENLSNRLIFFNDLFPEMSYDPFTLKDQNEMLMAEWRIDNKLSDKFLKKLIYDRRNRNVFWNIKKDKIQEIGTKDKDILNKTPKNGIFSVLSVINDEMTLFQKDLSSEKSVIKTFFSNANYSYIDMINNFSKQQNKNGFQLSLINKKIINIKVRHIFNSMGFSIGPQYITTQTFPGAQRETISGDFFVIETPRIKLYDFLAPFSHCIVYNHHQEHSFKVNKMNINHINFLEIEDFFLCSLNAIFPSKEDDF